MKQQSRGHVPFRSKKILFSLAFYSTKMKQPVALLLLILTVLSLASCSLEKRVYSNGYHISWMHTVEKGVLQVPSQDVAQDASRELSQNLPKDLSKNLSSNLEIHTLSDTITPTNKQEDYFGDKVHKPSKEKIRPYFQRPIKRPKTIEDLKLAIRFDFRLVLASFLLILFLGGLLYLGYLISFENLGVGIVLYLSALASVLAFFFYLLRGVLRTLKLVALKIFRKPDEARINKRKNHSVRESEHQFFRKILLAIGRFFRFLIQPKSFGSKVLLYLMALILGALIIGLSQ
ncbi:MAG: hypothetical protein RL664_1795 [Bacteroidota bacterium]